jgi:hypothetical protein
MCASLILRGVESYLSKDDYDANGNKTALMERLDFMKKDKYVRNPVIFLTKPQHQAGTVDLLNLILRSANL